MRATHLYIIKKVLLYCLIFVVSLSAFFFFINLVPGDPVTRYVESMRAQYSYSIPVSDELIQEYKKAFGLDKPLFTRYIYYMRELLLKQNFGPSFVAFPRPAHELILSALPWSIGLLGFSVIIAWVLGMVIGTIVGWKRGTGFDHSITPISLIVSQIPPYLLALLLLMLLSYALGIFPAGAPYAAHLERGFTLQFLFSLLYHAFLPSLSIVLVYLSALIISQRALVINLLGEDYVRFAEAKGLRSTRLVSRYILRNTLLPQTTGLAMSLGFIINGAFLIEWIFRYPGIGYLFITAINAMDYNILMGIVVVSMFFILLANLLIDLLYPLIDPRIRRGEW